MIGCSMAPASGSAARDRLTPRATGPDASPSPNTSGPGVRRQQPPRPLPSHRFARRPAPARARSRPLRGAPPGPPVPRRDEPLGRRRRGGRGGGSHGGVVLGRPSQAGEPPAESPRRVLSSLPHYPLPRSSRSYSRSSVAGPAQVPAFLGSGAWCFLNVRGSVRA